MATSDQFQRGPSENGEDLSTDDARQGVTGNNVRYVLAASLALSLVALYIAWHYI